MSVSAGQPVAVTASTAAAEQWLSFYLGAQVYAAPLAQVSEVIRPAGITPVPGAAPDLLGVCHLRGRIVPVMDGRRRLALTGLAEPDPAQVRVVLLTHDGQLIGLQVDVIGELLSTAGAEIEAPPGGRVHRADDPVQGVLPWLGGFVALLDVRRLCRLERGN
ncbi:MAG: chemotaxis protein CheW [Rhodanobacter sp.]